MEPDTVLLPVLLHYPPENVNVLILSGATLYMLYSTVESHSREIDDVEFLESIRRILFPADDAVTVDMELPAAALNRKPCCEQVSA